jgi:hypothetical protein
LLLLGNSGDRCLPPSVQKQDGRRNKPQRSPAGKNTIAAERRWPSPPEPHPPQVAAPIVQRSISLQRIPQISLRALRKLLGADEGPLPVIPRRSACGGLAAGD